MNKKFQKMIFGLLTSLMLFSISGITVNANENNFIFIYETNHVYFDTEENEFIIDLNEFDFNQPLIITEEYVNDAGEIVNATLEFIPAPSTRWSTSNRASTGTWRSSFRSPLTYMSYRFDVTRSGTQWRMSNARDHNFSAAFTSFSNPSLRITRATSTNTFPAEINASVQASVFNNQWVSIFNTTAWMRTTINSSGTMTLSGN